MTADPPSAARHPVFSGFVDVLGLEIDAWHSHEVVGHLDVGPQHHQAYGIVHGGVYCAVIETLASLGAATWAMEREMMGAVGLSNSTDFLRSHREGRLDAVARPVHQGRSQQLWLVEITRSADAKMVARGQVRLQNLSDADAIGGPAPT